MRNNIEIFIEILVILTIISLGVTNYSLSKDISAVETAIKNLKSEKGQMKYIASSYFDPNDDKKNTKYCFTEKDKRMNVARFTKEGEFIECFNW